MRRVSLFVVAALLVPCIVCLGCSSSNPSASSPAATKEQADQYLALDSVKNWIGFVGGNQASTSELMSTGNYMGLNAVRDKLEGLQKSLEKESGVPRGLAQVHKHLVDSAVNLDLTLTAECVVCLDPSETSYLNTAREKLADVSKDLADFNSGIEAVAGTNPQVSLSPAFGLNSPTAVESAAPASSQAAAAAAAPTTYESILADYSERIRAATPGLVDEYNAEAAGLSGDINALAKLSNEKISALAKISNEGISEMAKLMQKNHDPYNVYEEWAGKLTDVYMEEADHITDAYMNSAS